MAWITQETTLLGQTVELVPLDRTHFSALLALAKEERIWKYYAFDGTSEARMLEILEGGLKEREKGTQFPFVIFQKSTGKIIGSTRFLDIQPLHKKLEIGSTWLHPDYWGSEVNPECKLLLLTYSFESLRAVRVQLKTDERNIRSRKAIEKIGGVFEGVLRNDMVRDNGTLRNSAYYSITLEEWPDRKTDLIEQLQKKSRA